MRRVFPVVFLLIMIALFAAVAQAQGQTINVGDTVEGRLTDAAPRAEYTLTLAGPTDLEITLTSQDFDAYLVILDSAGSEIASDDDGAGQLNSLIVTTLDAGTYTLIATSLREYASGGSVYAIGDFTLSVQGEGGTGPIPTPTLAPTDQGGTPVPTPTSGPTEPAITQTPVPVEGQAIEYGQLVEGRLDQSTLTQEWAFEASAGDLITISMASEDFDTYLFLIDSEGSEVAFDDDSGGNLNSLIGPYNIPADGEYTIVANSYSNVVGAGPVEGGYTLIVSVVEAVELEVGTEIVDTLDEETPFQAYTFEGEAGELISVSLIDETFSVYVSLSGPDLAEQQTFGGTSTLGPVTLAESGTYTVSVGSYTPSIPSDYTLLVTRVVPLEIVYGFQERTSFEEGSPRYYNFEGQEGDVVGARVLSSGNVDTQIRLLDPDGFELAFDDDSGPDFDPEISGVVLPEDGIYSIVVSPYIPGDDGSFAFELLTTSALSLDDGPQTVRLSDKEFVGRLVFEGVAGETVRLTARSLTPTLGEPRIIVEQDQALLAANNLGTVSRLILEFVVPADGRVNVTVEDFNGYAAVVELTLERVPAEGTEEEGS
jgi:hypothetical protein